MKRSRSGCLNCKQRKRKCDQARPECQSCKSRNIRCSGYQRPVRWANGIASRGKFMGVNPGMSIPQAKPHEPIVISVSTTIVPPSNISVNPELEGIAGDAEQIIFDRFLTIGLSTISSGPIHRLAPYIAQLSNESTSLVTVAAALQSYLEGGLTVASMEYLDRALRAFRSELSCQDGALGISTVCSGLLLCTVCIYQFRPFTTYVGLIADLHNLPHILSAPWRDPWLHPLSHHFLEVIGIMDMPSFILGRVNPSRRIWKHIPSAETVPDTQILTDMEVVTGMPRSLLDIFARVGEDTGAVSEGLFWEWKNTEDATAQTHSWHSWRYAGILDVRRRRKCSEQGVKTLHDSEQVDNSPPHIPNSRVVLSYLMAELKVMYQKFRTPCSASPAAFPHGLLYPYTVASLELMLLRSNSLWKQLLQDIRVLLVKRFNLEVFAKLTELLDQAWRSGSDTFDIDEAARKAKVEIALF